MAPAVAGREPHPDSGRLEGGAEASAAGQVTSGQAVFEPVVFGPAVFGRVVAFGQAPFGQAPFGQASFGETVRYAVYAGCGYAVGAPVLAGRRR